MPSESPDKWDVSICGLNCAKCDIYRAGHGNKELRNEIIEWFKKERHESIKPDQVSCEGCRGSLDIHWSPECRILLCARNKGIKYCSQRRVFPCKVLEEFSSDGISHHKRAVEHLKRMKEIGIEAWIDQQKRNGQCVFCPEKSCKLEPSELLISLHRHDSPFPVVRDNSDVPTKHSVYVLIPRVNP